MYERDIWREDIVVPIVTTYAVPLRMRTHKYTIVKKEPVRPVQISWKKNVIVHIIPLRILSIALVFK